MKNIRLLLIFISMINLSPLLAQDDSAFAKVYRTIREMTDSLKTYSFYLITPYQSSRQIKLGNTYQRKLLSVFHFLKAGKEPSHENPDFYIGIIVDNPRLFDPSGGPGMVTRSSNGDGFVETANFTFSFTLRVHSRKREFIRYKFIHFAEVRKTWHERPQYSFNDLQKDSLSRNGYSLAGPTQTTSLTSVHRELLPTIEDYKYELSKLLDRYKNRYVDRVYN